MRQRDQRMLLRGIARAALAGRDIIARAYSNELARSLSDQPIVNVGKPASRGRTLVLCAALAEMFAERRGEQPPAWAAEIGGLEEPFILFRIARTNSEFRKVLEATAPEPLRRRNFLAAHNWLTQK